MHQDSGTNGRAYGVVKILIGFNCDLRSQCRATLYCALLLPGGFPAFFLSFLLNQQDQILDFDPGVYSMYAHIISPKLQTEIAVFDQKNSRESFQRRITKGAKDLFF